MSIGMFWTSSEIVLSCGDCGAMGQSTTEPKEGCVL